MSFTYRVTDAAVILTPKVESRGLLTRLLKRQTSGKKKTLSGQERDIAFALADLDALAEETGLPVQHDGEELLLPHRLCSALDATTASVLGLPRLVDRTLRTDVEGTPGSSSFRLHYEWVRYGKVEHLPRMGSILAPDGDAQRLPVWIFEALEVADQFRKGTDDATHWDALARFRQALDPGVHMATDASTARLSITDFLQGLEVQVADCFSLQPIGEAASGNFNVIPFSARSLDQRAVEAGEVSESEATLSGQAMELFHQKLSQRGALPAFRLKPNSYLVIDSSARPVLELMARKQKASPEERREFLQNPRAEITRVVEQSLRDRGRLDGLSDIGIEEMIETAAGPLLVETTEYSQRVTGVEEYEQVQLGLGESSRTTWMPEIYQTATRQDHPELTPEMRQKIDEAIAAGAPTVTIDGAEIPTAPYILTTVPVDTGADQVTSAMGPDEAGHEAPPPASESSSSLPAGRSVRPIVLRSADNFRSVGWHPEKLPRQSSIPEAVPASIQTPLKPHQIESFHWQLAAWKAGLPGILNADEQGLGKTLQTIAFIRWLMDQMADEPAGLNGPVLVVAPTSLLNNWQQEVNTHVPGKGIGHPYCLYGSGLSTYRNFGAKGLDTDAGAVNFDLPDLHKAIAEGRGHRYWVITTYTTLANYQHSFGRIPFAAAVFDEIQALKNPTSLRAVAARAVRADFRIGLTGTPIENSTTDLWAIMDQLCPGDLNSLADFRERFGTPTQDNMSRLHDLVFHGTGELPPMALRRLKETAASDLPSKTRKLHPRLMPTAQASTYELARAKLAEGSKGSALKMLHHIRSVSVHPDVTVSAPDAEYIAASARLDAAFSILDRIQNDNERALVFIEHLAMQHRFVALARHRYALAKIDVINGNTSADKRQEIVRTFQDPVRAGRGFDLLVLGPKAAGTGLTLTAATHVIHLSRWWNPAVEEQCNDRIHRMGQKLPVTIHIPMAVHSGYLAHSFDCLLHSLMQRKRKLAKSALWPMGDTGDDADELQEMLKQAATGSGADPVMSAMTAMFERDKITLPTPEPDRSLIYR